MKIVELRSENIKRLKAVELTLDPEQNLILVTGKNGQGKSSLLDSIFYALGGGKVLPEKPIRDGEDHAAVSVELSGTSSKGEPVRFTIKRTFTVTGTYLTITNRDGSKYSNPQEFLKAVVGALSFDPLEFSRMDPKVQVATLSKCVGLDLKEFDTRKKALTEERLGVYREMKVLSKFSDEEIAESKAIIEKNANLPAMTELVDRLQKADADIREYERQQAELPGIEKEIEELEQKMALLREKQKQIKELKRPTWDLEKMRKEVETLESRTNAVRDAQNRLKEAERVASHKARYDALSVEMDGVEKEKTASLSAAKMPIEGLSWDEENVLYNSIPFSQLSSAEQLRVALAIAIASNPKLKVILIRDGSLLDQENLTLIAEAAKENDMQVWIEKVDESGTIGIVIEDGEVNSIN